MDRFFDNYIMSAMQKPVFEALKAEGARKEEAMSEARVALDMAYAWLERRLAGRAWAGGEDSRWPTVPPRPRSRCHNGSWNRLKVLATH
jgi:hypothetical protein